MWLFDVVASKHCRFRCQHWQLVLGPPHLIDTSVGRLWVKLTDIQLANSETESTNQLLHGIHNLSYGMFANYTSCSEFQDFRPLTVRW